MATGWRLVLSEYKGCDFIVLFQCNFAFRGVCNRCASARPSGPFRSGAGAVGHGRGRVANDSGVPGRYLDFLCWQLVETFKFILCGNIIWAKCNVCNTNKPGHNEGVVRGGRGGGYKELEEELDETKRRRKEAEVRYSCGALDFEVVDVQDGEVDEFGKAARPGAVVAGGRERGYEYGRNIEYGRDRDRDRD
ncbi:hypothetical protein OIU78_006657 [Salix suchowensis]|nr:hypothetical protein OIU78_006657 [Salix suchowensis]